VETLPLNTSVIYNGSGRSAAREESALIVAVALEDEEPVYDLLYPDNEVLRKVPEGQLDIPADEVVGQHSPEEEMLGQEVRFRYREEKWRDYYGTDPIQTLDGVTARVAAVHLSEDHITFTLQFPGQLPLEKVHFYAEDLEKVPSSTPLEVEVLSF
jgi:hypothetical protein